MNEVYDGKYENGRIYLQAAEGDFILTRGKGEELWLYTPEAWRAFCERMNALPQDKRHIFLRHFVACAADVEAHGEFEVPEVLARYAALAEDLRAEQCDGYISIRSKI